MRNRIISILLDYVKKKHIPISSVVLGLFADEPIKHGATIPINGIRARDPRQSF